MKPDHQELAPTQAGDATPKLFHYSDIDSMKAHNMAFVAAYNFAQHLKALH